MNKLVITLFFVALAFIAVITLDMFNLLEETENEDADQVEIQTELAQSGLDITTGFFENNPAVEIKLEIARTSEEHQTGLMHRDSLEADSGMLFIFETEEVRTFWMKNTFIPLDIIFLDRNFEIVEIAENTEINQTVKRYSSKRPTLYVVEMNAGWSSRNNIEIGDRLMITDLDAT